MAKRKYSITEQQKQFRKIVLNKKMNHWQKYNKLFPEHEDVKKLIDCLVNYYKVPEPYATNIVMRLSANAYETFIKAST